MNQHNEESKTSQFIRSLCPDLSHEEHEAAVERFGRYLLLVKRVCEREERTDFESTEIDSD